MLHYVLGIHITCVVSSFILFNLRGYWRFAEAPILQQRLWARWVPDAVDVLLLVSGVTLALLTDQNPVEDPWLAAKLAALVLYILLGSVAIKYGRTRQLRIAAWLAACLVFVYIVGVAIFHEPISWVAAL